GEDLREYEDALGPVAFGVEYRVEDTGLIAHPEQFEQRLAGRPKDAPFRTGVGGCAVGGGRVFGEEQGDRPLPRRELPQRTFGLPPLGPAYDVRQYVFGHGSCSSSLPSPPTGRGGKKLTAPRAPARCCDTPPGCRGSAG